MIQNSKHKISAALAVFNEEQNLDQCLRSVVDWVEEIVVVDGDSTDKTREIAGKYQARVIKTTNKSIFHINKQMAIDNCAGEWVLQLDADEVVSAELREEVIAVINDNLALEAYFIPRKNFFLGRWLKKGGQYPDGVIRLFKNGKAKLPCRSVHEQMQVNGQVGWLKSPLFHYPYPSFAEYLKKSDRYTSLSANELFRQKEKPGFGSFFKAYLKAEKTFWQIYLRHKGFLDGFPGFIFALYSGLHQITAYVKFWELYRKKKDSG